MKPRSKKKGGVTTLPEVAGSLMSGAEAVLRALTGSNNTVAVCSETMTNGISLSMPDTDGSIRTLADPAAAVAYASGLAVTGNPTAVFLESTRLTGISDQLKSATEKHLPITVVVSRPLSASNRLSDSGAQTGFSALRDSGCPILAASSVQELVDFISIARALSVSALIPVVVVADGRDTVWSIQSVIIPDPGFSLIASGTIETYREMLFGSTGANRTAWVDPGNPIGLGMEMSDSTALKVRVGRHAFVHRELAELIARIWSDFSERFGRQYGPVTSTGPENARIVLVASGSTAERLEGLMVGSGKNRLRIRIVRISTLRPFPGAEIAAEIRNAAHVGVLVSSSEADLDDLDLVRDIRSSLFGKRTEEKNRRSSTGSATIVTPVLYSEGWSPTLSEVKALASRLESDDSSDGPVVLGAGITTLGIRAPEIERIGQQLNAAGIDLAHYELTVGGSRGAVGHDSLIVLAESARDTWRMLQDVTELLKHAGASGIHAAFHPNSDATRRPVIGRVFWQGQSNAPVMVLVSRPALFHSHDVRTSIPAGAHILVKLPSRDDDSSGPETAYPAWMSSTGATVTGIAATDPLAGRDGSHHPDLLLIAAFVIQHPMFATVETSSLLNTSVFSSFNESELSAFWESMEAYLPVQPIASVVSDSDTAPESKPPLDIVEQPAAQLPVANLNRFWKTTGYLYRAGRTDEFPVDPFLTSGMLPARAGALTAHASESNEVPRVISERCTGCGACWAVCPEAAFVTRLFTVESLFDSAMENACKSGNAFVQIPRLKPAIVKRMHRLASRDELHQFQNVGSLLTEALEQVLDKGGVEEEKRLPIEKERDALLAPVSSLRTVRTHAFFDAPETDEKGSGRLMALAVDPDACTACRLCYSSCDEDALEAIPGLSETVDSAEEWLAVSGLKTPRLSLDLDLLKKDSTLTPLLLEGPTTARVYRAGGADVGNLNRTVLKLFLESQNAHSAPRAAVLADRIRTMIERIDRRIQEQVNETVEINDFQAFARSLQDIEGDINPGRLTQLAAYSPESTSDRKSKDGSEGVLAHLARLREELSVWLESLAPSGDPSKLPHMVLVIAMSKRSFGLTGYPINPFAMPTIHANPEHATDVVAGIEDGLRERYGELHRLLRTAELVIEDVYEPGAERTDEQEQRSSITPDVLLVTDRFDNDLIKLLSGDRNVNVLLLSGGVSANGVGIRQPDPLRLALALDRVYLRQTTPADPVALLAAFYEGLAHSGPCLFRVYAPDSVRDGIPLGVALDTAQLAVESRVFPDLRREPGSPPEILSKPGPLDTGDSGPGHWIVAQERFERLFKFVPKRDWSGEQIPMSEWLSLPSNAQPGKTPYIDQLENNGQTSRFLLDPAVASFTANREAAWNEWLNLAGLGRASRAAESIPEQVTTAVDPPVQPQPIGSGDTDALQTLSDRLLRLSGFGGSDVPLESLVTNSDEEGDS